MIGKDYIQWLYDNYGCPNYTIELFEYLASKNYIWQMTLDANRAAAGLRLRDQFAYETGVYRSDVADGPCSVLEMLCALAEDVYDNCGQRTPIFFLNAMLDNLGIVKNIDNANYILDRWLNRDYEADGKGSIFYIPNCQVDLRRMDVWSQMKFYISTYYPLDPNFLNN